METKTEQIKTSGAAQLRAKLSLKAKLEPKFRFYTLYHHLYRDDVLTEAWKKVKENGGSAGIDGISIRSIERAEGGVHGFLKRIQEELKTKTYYPQPVKRVFIPKSDGKLRPLGIPTIKDRIVQAAMLIVIEPIFEQDFLECSYGFRPGKSTYDALDAIKQAIAHKKLQIYDADMKSYFDTIPHDKLILAIERRIADQSIIKLIRKWLRAPIWEAGKPMKPNDKGTPQGGIISPLLANLYLHWFDKIFHGKEGPGQWAKATLVRYADDYVIMAKYMTSRITSWIENITERRFGLIINKEKTKIVNLETPKDKLDFLGYSMRVVPLRNKPNIKFCLLSPSKKSQQKAREKIRAILSSSNGYKPIQEITKSLNQFLEGWGQYFHKGHPGDAFNKLNRYVQERMYGFLQRRSQRGFRKRNKKASWYQYFKEDLGIIQLTKERYLMKA